MRRVLTLVLIALLCGAVEIPAMDLLPMRNIEMKGELGARWQAAKGNMSRARIATDPGRWSPAHRERRARCGGTGRATR